MNIELKGKKALVTGGSRGIGGAISEILATAGADVAILGRSHDSLEMRRQSLISKGVEALTYACDVLNENEVAEVWSDLESKWGGVDILINNVGGGGRWGSENILETPQLVWDQVLRKNLGVASQLTTSALPYMKKNGWGRIVCITSIYGNSIGGRPWFNIAKVAQNTFIKNLAKNLEFTRFGITFNSVAPGAVYIDGTGWEKMLNEKPIEFNNFVDTLPLGRMGSPEEVASLVLFLCSTYSSYVNGASIIIDGGETSSLV